MQSTEYFMDDVREAGRLAEKVDPDLWVSRYVTPRLNGSRSVLDVGCGPGVLAEALARAHRQISVTGIDLCADRFDRFKPAPVGNIVLRAGNALSLPFADNTFDFVYCRFLLEYLTDREVAVGEMRRVCKPGGQVLLQDLDGQLLWHYPPDQRLEEMLHRMLRGLHGTGFDPMVGRTLYSLAYRAGLIGIEAVAESYHLIAGKIDPTALRLWELKLDIAMPACAKIAGESEALRLKEMFLAYLSREDTLTYSVLFTVCATKKP